MKIFNILTVFVSICIFSVSLAGSGSQWYDGAIVLNDGTELAGAISYSDDVVQVHSSNTIKAFSTLQVRHFTFFDSEMQERRNFVPIDRFVTGKSIKPSFYEMVCQGPITLLRKETVSYELANEPYKERDLAHDTRSLQRFQHDVHIQKRDFDYFFLYEGGLNPLRNFKKDIRPILTTHAPAVNRFIETNSLNTKAIKDQEKIITFYNQLQQGKDMALQH